MSRWMFAIGPVVAWFTTACDTGVCRDGGEAEQALDAPSPWGTGEALLAYLEVGDTLDGQTPDGRAVTVSIALTPTGPVRVQRFGARDDSNPVTNDLCTVGHGGLVIPVQARIQAPALGMDLRLLGEAHRSAGVYDVPEPSLSALFLEEPTAEDVAADIQHRLLVEAPVEDAGALPSSPQLQDGDEDPVAYANLVRARGGSVDANMGWHVLRDVRGHEQWVGDSWVEVRTP